jgi:hypothetical protein
MKKNLHVWAQFLSTNVFFFSMREKPVCVLGREGGERGERGGRERGMGEDSVKGQHSFSSLLKRVEQTLAQN